MKIYEIREKVLEWLYMRYKEEPNKLWDISLILKECGIENVRLVGNIGYYLKENGFIKKTSEKKLDTYLAAISIDGIEEISMDITYLTIETLEKLIGEKELSLMNIMNLAPTHYQRAYDFSLHLEEKGLIKCRFIDSDILISITLDGCEYYKNNKAVYYNKVG